MPDPKPDSGPGDHSPPIRDEVPEGTRDDARLDRAKVAGAFKDLLTPANIFLLGLVILILLTGFFGGWNNLSESKRALPMAEAGKDLEANPFRIQVRKAMWFTHFPQMYALKPGQRALVVPMDVTNISDHYVSVQKLQDALRLEGLQLIDRAELKAVPSGKAAPYIVRGRDGFAEQTLQPGLTVRLGVIWVQDANAPVPQNLDLNLFKQSYRKSSLDGSMGYFDRQPIYHLRLPLSEMKVPG